MKIEDLSFLAGSWECPIWGGIFHESWMPATGGTMIGCGRHIAGGETKFIEYMSIEPTEQGLTMFMILGAPSKGEKTPVPFVLGSHDQGRFVFENLKNDYPQRIIYSGGASGMSCVIEGPGESGTMKQDKFDFKSSA